MIYSCDCCDKTYKKANGLKNHRNKIHGINDPIVLPTKTTGVPSTSDKIDAVTQKHSLYVHINEFNDFNNHINQVLNSFSDAFLTAINAINDNLDALKMQNSPRENFAANCEEQTKQTRDFFDNNFDATPQITSALAESKPL